jgi:hypothetical protein
VQPAHHEVNAGLTRHDLLQHSQTEHATGAQRRGMSRLCSLPNMK